MPRFADEHLSLSGATDEEVAALWRAGFTPLGWMLWRRLADLWDFPILDAPCSPQTKVRDYRDLLLFPTGNRARSMSTVRFEENWPYDARIAEGDGTYQAQSNFAKLTNPLYDYVADQYGEYPRTGETQRPVAHGRTTDSVTLRRAVASRPVRHYLSSRARWATLTADLRCGAGVT